MKEGLIAEKLKIQWSISMVNGPNQLLYGHFIRDNLDYVTRVMIIIFFKYYSAMFSLNEQKRNELVSRSQSDILAPNETSRSKEISTLKRKSIFNRKCLFNP